jgi:hypothetical protein
MNWRGAEPVPREEVCEPREVRVARVRGEEQDQERCDLDGREQRAVPEHRERNECDYRPVRTLARPVDVVDVREDGDPDEEDRQEDAHDHERLAGVARFRLLERLHPVGDGLHPGERRTAVRERLEDQEDRQGVAASGFHVRKGLRRTHAEDEPDEPPHHQAPDEDDVEICRDREHDARLLHAA